jgi:hypothetical protein
MIIVGSHFFTFGSNRTPEIWRCLTCGTEEQFTMKSGIRLLTLYFFIPVLPLSGIQAFVQCPRCGARYRSVAAN